MVMDNFSLALQKESNADRLLQIGQFCQNTSFLSRFIVRESYESPKHPSHGECQWRLLVVNH